MAESGAKETGFQAPVTLLTGYLGSGKTTLLKHLASMSPNKRIAVIENEFGAEVGVEKAIIEARTGGNVVLEELFELANGCVCCSLRGEFERALDSLVSRPDRFDHIVVETTGLADPGPVASVLWSDDALVSRYYLDAIVTLIDAKNFMRHYDDPERPADAINEAARQVAFADVLVVNKTDLVTEAELEELLGVLRGVNSLAKIVLSQNSAVAVSDVVGLRAHATPDAATPLSVALGSLDRAAVRRQAQTAPRHQHDASVRTVLVSTDKPVSRRGVSRWLAARLWDGGAAADGEAGSEAKGKGGAAGLFRIKGVLAIRQEEPEDQPEHAYLVQGVHDNFSIEKGALWGSEETAGERVSRIVFIGRNLDFDVLQKEFEAAAADEGATQ